jgi:hypothetical protein
VLLRSVITNWILSDLKGGGDVMKKQYASILIALAGFLGFSVVAEAQQGEIVVAVPFEFVVAGTTLPAGTYTVSRLAGAGLRELAISSYENRAGALVVSDQFESYPAGDAKLSFQQIGDTHVLNKIETLNGVYSIPVRRSNNAVARMAQHQDVSGSGTN